MSKCELDTGTMYTYYVPMNVTLALPDRLVEQARRVAQARGMSLNEMIRQELLRIAGHGDQEAVLAELRQRWANPRGDSGAWVWNRNELYDRPVLR